VLALNAVGYSLPSNYLEIMPAVAPGSPGQPTATAVSSTSISIAWTFDSALNGGTPITDYRVYWDNGVAGKTLEAASSTGSWQTFTTTAVTAGTTYSFWVAAVNYIGLGTPSSKLSVLAASFPDIPTSVAAVASFNSYQVTWTAPNSRGSAISYYSVFVDSDGDAFDNFVLATQTTSTSYSITYKFQVSATNAIGSSAKSATTSVLAASVPAQPVAPLLLTQDATQITVQWSSPDGRGLPITNFELNWDAGFGGTPRTVLSLFGNNVFSGSTTIAVADLADGANFMFAIRAKNLLGFGAYSSATTIIAASVPG
jgi:hypothetical protein